MARRVVLTMTPSEARMLSYLAGDLLTDPQELRNRLGGRDYNTAIRVANKLGAAIMEASRSHRASGRPTNEGER